MGRRTEPAVLTGIGEDALSSPPPEFWASAHQSLRSLRTVDDMRLDRPLHLPPSPRAAAASPLNAGEPEPRPPLRLLQHPGAPQSPHVTSDSPITAAPAHIKGAGRPLTTPAGLPGGSGSAGAPVGSGAAGQAGQGARPCRAAARRCAGDAHAEPLTLHRQVPGKWTFSIFTCAQEPGILIPEIAEIVPSPRLPAHRKPRS